MARKSPRPKSQQPESRVILVDLTRADWKPIDPRKRSVEVEQCIAFLSERIRGQPKGIEAIADAYELYLSGEQDPRYPICKFLFLGPSGTGKTQLVRTFALFLFGDESAMTRIDCSEYVHRADVTRLLGSSPGYIRSDEIPILAQQRLDYPAWKALHEPRLRQLRSQQQAVENARPKKEKDLKDAQRALRQAATEAARRKLQNEVTQLASELQRIESERQAIEQEISQLVFRPGTRRYPSIVLFDEIEKGDPQLQHMLLQIMDYARVTVSLPQPQTYEGGRKKSGSGATNPGELQKRETTVFSHSFLFMTSNTGRKEIESLLAGRGTLGFAAPAKDAGAKRGQAVYEEAMRAARKTFGPEFRRRLDSTIVFQPLSDAVLVQIADDLVYRQGAQLMERRGILLIVTEGFKEYLVAEAKEHREEGASVMEHKLQSQMVKPINRMARSGEIRKGDVVLILMKDEDGKAHVAYVADERTRRAFARAEQSGAGTVEIRIKPEAETE